MIRTACYLAVLLTAGVVFAQERSGDSASYRAEFTIRDSTDTSAAKAGRRYTMLIDPAGKGSLRVGNRLPYFTGQQWNYFDVGVNIECRVREQGGKLAVNSDVDISSVIEHPKGAANSPQPNPTVSSVRLSLGSNIPPGKPTLIGSFNDPVTNRTFDVQITVTRVD